MLSKTVRKVFKLYFGWTNFIKIYPYVYDSTDDECRLSLSPQIHKWYFTSGVLLAHSIFGAGRIFYEYFAQNGRTEDFLFRFFFIAASGLGVTNQINAYYCKREVTSCINAFLQFDQRCSRLYETRGVRDICGLYVGFLFPMIVASQSIVYGGLYFYNPKSPNYYNSLLPYDKYSTVSLLMAIPEMAMFILTWSSVFFSLLFVFSFQMSAKYWLKQISVSNLTKKSTRSKLRNPETAMVMYRQLHILTTMFNNAMADIYQPLHSFLMGSVFVTCAFTSVRYYDRMHWFPYSLNPLTSAAVVVYKSISYPTAAGILISSESFRRAWKKSLSESMVKVAGSGPGRETGTQKDNPKGKLKELLWYLRSCSTLGIRMGGQYCVDRHSLITCLDIMVDQAISLLVGVKKH